MLVRQLQFWKSKLTEKNVTNIRVFYGNQRVFKLIQKEFLSVYILGLDMKTIILECVHKKTDFIDESSATEPNLFITDTKCMKDIKYEPWCLPPCKPTMWL